MNITNNFKSGCSKKPDLSDQSNDGEDYKKPREGSLNDFFALNSTVLEDEFTWSLHLPERGAILIKFLRSIEQKMNEMIALVKTTQENQITSELHMNKLQETVDFISATFDKYEKTRSKGKKK